MTAAPYFKFMQQCVPTVCHKHASALSKKSETVSYNSYMYESCKFVHVSGDV